ncbi:hypothetical protein F4774DRAFT_405555 [Daldinia eschscholtzii]|nr:hypothetical protein F4774DRAFT_405555 [Daldinia eschscholtzii]
MQPPGLARRRSYSFYIFILLDKTTQKRHAWLVKDKTKIQSGNYVYYSGRVIGQILEQHIIHAGNEPNTPSGHRPILVLVPTESLRPVLQYGASDSSGDLQETPVKPKGKAPDNGKATAPGKGKGKGKGKATEKGPGSTVANPHIVEDDRDSDSLSDMSSLESLSDVFKQNTADRNASLAEDSNDDDEYGPFPDIDDVLGNMEDFQGGTQTTMPSQPHAEQEHEPEYEPEEPEPEPEQASAAQKRNDAEDGQNETGENDGGFRKSKRRRH